MHHIAIGILTALLAGSSPIAERWEEAIAVELEYQRLLEDDDVAIADVTRWIRENEAFRRESAGVSQEELSARIATRLKTVLDGYEEFLKKHPSHVEGRIAYGSFLNEVSEEDKAAAEWEKARLLEPNNPAPWNNLANHFGHFGGVTNSFAYYAKAIELNPFEPVYYQNLATTVYLFRRDAEAFYGINEQQVFDKALGYYRKALELSPGSFPVATDLAQTYYGIMPFRLEEAMAAWREALALAQTDEEKQAVYIHFARLNIRAGRYPEAGRYLAEVILPQYEVLKKRLLRLMEQKQAGDEGASGSLTEPEAK